MSEGAHWNGLLAAAAPVLSSKDDAPEAGIALCLSGGGYRAMLYHAGVLLRLNDTGLLSALDRVSSVSGGSIAAGVLGHAWHRLDFGPGAVAGNFTNLVIEPIRTLSRINIDAHSVLGGVFGVGSAADRVAEAYAEHLFGDATLQALPDAPRFVINATNVQSGALWRFSKPYMGDYRVDRVPNPDVSLATAVACSSAFPPFLSPIALEIPKGAMVPAEGVDLHDEPYTRKVVLTDGGVYDNLGLETAWKRYDTVLISDGGGGFEAEPKPKRDWAQHAYRVLNLVDNQVRSLRKRQVIAGLKAGTRKGAYWGIRTDIADYTLADALPCPHHRTLMLADTPTRLAKVEDVLQERLINWGYAAADAGLRRHYRPDLAPPADFPYPRASV